MGSRWLVFRERSRLRWGGDLRRHYVLAALATRTDALDVDGWSFATIDRTIKLYRGHRWERRPKVAAATMLSQDALDLVGSAARPVVVDFHDDAVAQNEALGVAVDSAWISLMTERKRRNLELFKWHVVPSLQLAALSGLDPARTIIAGNGSDTNVIGPEPWSSRPTIGLMSGAAPARGIEALIDASRGIRHEIRDLRLVLWLAATGAASESYLTALKASIADDPWIVVRSTPYADIAHELGEAWVQVIPTPASPYWDAVSPIKLYDAMASGRPVVVTPRTVMSSEVERCQAGLVSAGDRPDDLAQQILTLLSDEATARRLGENGRRAVVRDHDWRAISSGLLQEIESREGSIR